MMVRLPYIFLLLTGFSLISFGQASPAIAAKPDAAELLQQISKKYATATYYHVEATQESISKSALSGGWDKSIFTAIVAPGNRYRFEGHTSFGWPLKVSDGKTEIHYNADFHEYTQQSPPETLSLLSHGEFDERELGLLSAVMLLKSLSKSLATVLAPSYLPDETLTMDGRQIPCYVVKGKTRYIGGSPAVDASTTFWIDKENLLVRKERDYREGPIDAVHPQSSISDETTLYTVMEINGASVADSFFSFQPPADARLVKEFSPMHSANLLAGKSAPSIKLHDAKGKLVTLQDFHGKPVLLDFWATWCGPCVAALDSIKKLHEETAAKGLVLLSIDEDEDARTAADFWARRGISWPDFHDDGEVWRTFPGSEGIPYYVLIDGDGRIVLSKTGAKDSELRAAIAKLGIDLPASQAASDSKPKQ